MAWLRCLYCCAPRWGAPICRDGEAALSTGGKHEWAAVTLHGTSTSSEQVRQESKQVNMPALSSDSPLHWRAGLS